MEWIQNAVWSAKMDFRNWLLQKILKHTHLNAFTVYDMLWKMSNLEIQSYLENIIKAREESGCLSMDDYLEWLKNQKKL